VEQTRVTRRQAFASVAAATPALARPEEMPTVRFGNHTLSRLIVGGNPVSGNSHLNAAVNREMIDYFTAQNVKKLLANCEHCGITAWQSRGDRHILRLLHEYRQEGGRLDWIAQTASELGNLPAHIRNIAALEEPIAIYNHGANTDNLWQSGRIETVREQCKVIRDTGALVGVGTHIPQVVEYVDEKGWEVDFFMTCLYNLSRTREDASRIAGKQVADELFWDADREEMLNRVRGTSKPCLIFKVYAATRKCGSPEQMLDAMKLVFRYAKPTDAVVIGMFPKYKEQVDENRRLLIEAIRRTAT
jgi:hypothetical protein